MEIKRLKSSLQFAKMQYDGCPDDTNKLMLERAQAAYDAALDAESSNSEAVVAEKSNTKAKEPAKKAAPKPKAVAAPKEPTTPEATAETPEADEPESEDDGENPEKKTE